MEPKFDQYRIYPFKKYPSSISRSLGLVLDCWDKKAYVQAYAYSGLSLGLNLKTRLGCVSQKGKNLVETKFGYINLRPLTDRRRYLVFTQNRRVFCFLRQNRQNLGFVLRVIKENINIY